MLAQPENELLTNAVDVSFVTLALKRRRVPSSSPGDWSRYRVRPLDLVKGRFFIQDATSGVFVDNVNGRRPEAGELVEVSGITYAGA